MKPSLWQSLATAAALPGAILTLVLLMVVPVPALLLDIGFIANIMISLAVLMVALSAAKPLDFSAFPTVLLLATLFRLALNVASTRVVLVQGHQGAAAAGHVIEAFGAFLIGGDYVVGLFVFAVLMIINLVVITKGAGRVSEVSARFTLDALPGKQMAIDADLNAGLLSPDEAKARRQEVATEADFYGSMDGASKFVKGDAVAGLLILFVNIIGGLILGVISHELSLGDAARTYITLAIGDALVAQIPALLLSIAAAAIVTRVSSPFDLSGQIGSQFGQWRAWAPVAAILTLLGLIPAMPQLVVLPAAGVAGGICWLLRNREQAERKAPAPIAVASEPHRIAWEDVCETAPVALELGYALVGLVDERKNAPLMARITTVRRQLSRELGFVLPPVKVADDLSLPGNAYRIRIAGVVVGEDEVWPGDLFALAAGDTLEPVAGRACKDPSFGLDALWIAADRQIDAVANGYTVVDPATVIATHLNQLLARSATELFGLDEAQALVETLKAGYPQLAQGLTPQPFSLAAIAALCRSLLAERVPLRDFRALASAMIAAGKPDMPPGDLTEAVRRQLGGLIVQTISPAQMPLLAVTLAPDLEALLIQSVRAAPDAAWPIEPELARRIVASIGEAVEPLLLAARGFAVIVAPLCRPAMARLLRAQFADVAVLSFLEIPEAKPVEIIATVGDAIGDAALPAPDITEKDH
ncbi:MAG: flagellar biosynthesis protein FlhA [Sphingomonadales bacterium]|jgi:flagellar biosynthesis protein FlhA|nr:flagellar biosynthesis protein FlhA [Sphingomonadales bacterium]MBK9004789.1 flagellar biosynthesis protein FlhA [Sphingomonadales bacterium]MBK9267484.1 flagellar biosynthesis protein FlhA [Sphingomonadales bacterium]MBP6433231.1 flagellar biosynthesis protein FlhA [Sphingorhabdus sp.]